MRREAASRQAAIQAEADKYLQDWAAEKRRMLHELSMKTAATDSQHAGHAQEIAALQQQLQAAREDHARELQNVRATYDPEIRTTDQVRAEIERLSDAERCVLRELLMRTHMTYQEAIAFCEQQGLPAVQINHLDTKVSFLVYKNPNYIIENGMVGAVRCVLKD